MSRIEELKNTVRFFHDNKIGAVLPVAPNEKTVKIKRWQERDSKNLYPNLHIKEESNYTVVSDSDIYVVDVDLKEIKDEVTKKAYEKALFSYPMFQDTLSTRTTSGGFHFYFRCKKKNKLKGTSKVFSLEDFPELTIIDLPLNTVMPGSIYNSKKYEFINQIKPLRIESLHDLPILTKNQRDKNLACYTEIFEQFKVSKNNGLIKEGDRNKSFYTMFKIMGSYKIPKSEAREIFFDRYFDKFEGELDTNEVESSLESAYKNIEDQDKKEKQPKEISVREYMEANEWHFRDNVIKEQKEMKQGQTGQWRQFNQYLPSALAVDMAIDTGKGSFKDYINLYIEAQCLKNVYHAGKEFVETIEREETDHFDTFIEAIKTDINKSFLKAILHRWFLESLYTLQGISIDNAKTNRTCLVFQGAQQIGKTGLSKIICPPQLRDYRYVGDIAHNRDYASMIADYAFIVLDDIDNMDYAEKKNLKSLMTQTSIKNRRAFARESTSRPAISNFIATTNQPDVLTDITGNTRYFPIKIEAIDWNIIDNPDDNLIMKMWGYAAYLYDNSKLKEVRQETDKFKDDRLNQVKKFEKLVGAEEILSMYFTNKPEDKAVLVEIPVTQIALTFTHFYSSQDKKMFSRGMVSNALIKMGIEERSTNSHRFKQLYLYENMGDEVSDTLMKWHLFFKKEGEMPKLIKNVSSSTLLSAGEDAF